MPSQDNLLSWLEIWRKTWSPKMNLGRSRLHFRGNKKSCGYYGSKWELPEGIVDMMDKWYLNISNVPSLWQETGINKQFYIPNSSHHNFVVWQTSGGVLGDASGGSGDHQWGAYKSPLTTTNSVNSDWHTQRWLTDIEVSPTVIGKFKRHVQGCCHRSGLITAQSTAGIPIIKLGLNN